MPRQLAVCFCFVVASLATAQEKPDKLSALFPKLEQQVQRGMQNTGVPGVAVVIVHHDKVVYLKGFGVCKAGEPAKVTGDTVFQVASVSKPFTTTALALLVGQGRIDWDDRISDLHPAFALHDPWVSREVRLRDMLSHRSGLPGFAGDMLEDIGYRRDTILQRLRLVELSGFRQKYAYTNFGFTMAAEAVAKKLDTTWEELIEAELLQPAGLKATSPRFADYQKVKHKAVGHMLTDGKATAQFVRDPDPQAPAGGISSTARDVGRWMRLHLGNGKLDGKQLIDAAALAETHRPHILTGFNPASFGDAGFYALGWNVSTDSQGNHIVGHSGAFFLGFRTKVTLVPKEHLGIAVLANGNITGLPEGLSSWLLDSYLLGEPTRDWIIEADKKFGAMMQQMLGASFNEEQPVLDKSPPLTLKRYAGAYHNDYFGKITVAAREGRLTLGLGPQLKAFPLRHFNRDIFVYEPLGENGAGTKSGVHFRIAPDGRASAVLIDHLNELGHGEFERVSEEED